jgi:hypothetical protein
MVVPLCNIKLRVSTLLDSNYIKLHVSTLLDTNYIKLHVSTNVLVSNRVDTSNLMLTLDCMIIDTNKFK